MAKRTMRKRRGGVPKLAPWGLKNRPAMAALRARSTRGGNVLGNVTSDVNTVGASIGRTTHTGLDDVDDAGKKVFGKTKAGLAGLGSMATTGFNTITDGVTNLFRKTRKTIGLGGKKHRRSMRKHRRSKSRKRRKSMRKRKR